MVDDRSLYVLVLENRGGTKMIERETGLVLLVGWIVAFAVTLT